MSVFRGGPADGVYLMFKRGPLFVRVVVDYSEEPELGHPRFGVLDQLDDEPQDGEEVFVYRRVGPSRRAHLNNRGSRKGPQSGFYEFADYEYVDLADETRALLRDTESWRAWVDETRFGSPDSGGVEGAA